MCDLSIDHPSASKQHAVFQYRLFLFFHSMYQGLPFLAFVVWCLSLLLNFSLADLSAKKERMEQRWTSNDFLSLVISHYNATDRLVMQNPWLDWFYEMRPAPQGPALRHRSWFFERNLLEQYKVFIEIYPRSDKIILFWIMFWLIYLIFFPSESRVSDIMSSRWFCFWK